MRWFKHDADAITDYKIKKLIMRYGAIGYAIYFHCLELIAGDVNETHITFELEHDSEIIADDLKIQGTKDMSAIDIVNSVMLYIVELGLFECSNGRIFCFKLLKRLDSSMTGNVKMRGIISTARAQYHDSIMTQSCKTRLEENRIDKKREIESRHALPVHGSLENVYLSETELSKLDETYGEHIRSDYVERLSTWKPNAQRKVKNDYATLLTWIRKDKIPKLPPKESPCPICGGKVIDGQCRNAECPQYGDGGTK